MRLRLIQLLILMLVCMAFSLDHARASDKDAALEKAFFAQVSEFYSYAGQNRAMMPITIIGPDSKPVDMAAGGDLVLLHFWATWCPPCVKELPRLDKLARAFEGKGLRVVPVSLDYGLGPAGISKFMKKNGAETLPPFRVLSSDPAWEALRKFALPSTFLIHPDGRVLYKMVGDIDWTSDPSGQFLTHLLSVTLH